MSFAKHKALDELHATLSEKVDLFVEAFLGRMKKQPLKKFVVETKATTDVATLEKYLEAERDKLTSLSTQFAKLTEFQNIIDEMKAEIDKTLYLCRLS
jgi:hypothetical protein